MPKYVQLKNNLQLALEDKPFASGGEGDLYRIIHPGTYNHLVVKLYKPEKQTDDRRRKLEYLAANPPPLHPHNGHHAVIWIQDLVTDKGKFVGYTMPLAKGEKLEFLCHAKLPKKLGNDWLKFDFQNPRGLDFRLKVCFNIAVALYQIHSTGNYVLVDMKPENIMIQANGLISIIDADSVEVYHNGQVLFQAPVATPEYSPPEYYRGVKPETVGASEVWDRFSLAVIFYRLLCGIHPFAGSCKPPFETCNGIADMVENGLFPHGKKATYFRLVPPPHSHFRRLSAVVQEHFLRCFEDGFNIPTTRPSAEEWCKVLEPMPQLVGARQMPSSLVFFPANPYATPLTLSYPTTIPIPKDYSIMQFRDSYGLDLLVQAFFGQSAKQQLKEQIEIQQAKIQGFLHQKTELETVLKQIAVRFTGLQDAILKKEKDSIDQVYQWWALKIAKLDEQAQKAEAKESVEMQKAQVQLAMQIARMEKELHSFYQQKILPIENKYKTLFEKTQQELRLLQVKQTQIFNQETANTQASLVSTMASLEKEKQQALFPLQLTREKQKALLLKAQNEQKSGSHATFQQIHDKHERLYLPITKRTHDLSIALTSKLSKIKQDTSKRLSENLKINTSRLHQTQRDIARFLTTVNSELKTLGRLQEQYKRL